MASTFRRRHAHQWVRSFAFPGWVCAVDSCSARRRDVAECGLSRYGAHAPGLCSCCTCLTTTNAGARTPAPSSTR